MNSYFLLAVVPLLLWIVHRIIDAVLHAHLPNYEIYAYGTCIFGDICITRKEVFAWNDRDAIRQAKRLAREKDVELGWRYPNHSIYEDGEYPNSLGTVWACSPIKNAEHRTNTGIYR